MESSRGNIWKNSFFLFFSQLIRLLTNFFIFIGIARLYGPEGFGQFSIAFTVANICIMIADFGFDVLLASEIAKNRNDALQISRKYFSMKIVFAVIGSLLMILIPSFQGFSDESRLLIYTLPLYVIFTTFTNFFYAIFRGFEKFEYETRNSFFSNLFLLAAVGFLGYLKTPLFYLMFFFIGARFLGVILGISKATKLVGANILRLNFKGWRLIINQILIFGLTFLFGNLFIQLDTLLIGIWKGDEAAGLYQAAFRIVIFFLLFPDLLMSAFLPIMSRLFFENIDRWKNYSRLLYKILLFISIPTTLVIFFNAKQFINLIYSNELFDKAIPVLQIFSLIIFVRFIVEPFGLMMTTSKRQHIRMILVIVATVLSFIINYFVIPAYGLNGAAMVSLIMNIMVGSGYLLVNFSSFFEWTFEKSTIIVLFTSILLGLILWSLTDNIVATIISISIYILIVYFIAFSSEERKIIFSNFTFKRI